MATCYGLRSEIRQNDNGAARGYALYAHTRDTNRQDEMSRAPALEAHEMYIELILNLIWCAQLNVPVI